jgi:outer membrane protein
MITMSALAQNARYMKTLPGIFFAVIIPLVSGCALFRPTDPYTPVELSCRPRASAAPLPVVPDVKTPGKEVTLQQAIDIGLSNNPEIAAVHWESMAAKARHDQSIGERLPRLGAIGGYTRYHNEQRLLPPGLPGDPSLLSRDIFSADAVLSLPIFTGGGLVNRVRASEYLAQAAIHRLSRSREELVFNISSTFFSILAQQHVVRSLEFSLTTLEAHVKRIDALIAAQKAANVDRLRTEVQLADVRQQLVREKNLMTIQRRVLANFLGLEENIDDILLQGELEFQNKPDTSEFDSSLVAALENRDDYLAARRSLEAQARRVDIAEAVYLPAVFLRGSYGVRLAAGRTRGTGDDFGNVGGIGLAMEIPIFEGGKVHAGINEQRAELASMKERLHTMELQIRLEIQTALSNIRSSEERLEAILKSIDQARESLRIEQQKYDLGKGAIVDVLDSQGALLESETTYYRVLAELHMALAQLKLARGEE